MSMEPFHLLLDTPKKLSLQIRAEDLRASLKDWERSFAIKHGGKKPGKLDIKVNAAVAANYKEYNKVRSLLGGNTAGETSSPTRSPSTRSKQLRIPRPANSNAQKVYHDRTPQKSRTHPNQVDPYDIPASISPRPVFSKTIGPTPQRDGQVMGLFDMLYNSDSRKGSNETPSANRKRKIDAVDQSVVEEGFTEYSKITRTPSQRPGKHSGNVFAEPISPDVARLCASGGRRHSRTPASEGRRFMLDQILGTANALRYASLIQGQGELSPDARTLYATPLRDSVLGKSPTAASHQAAPDATPAYLKRSYSFKQRLLSASKSSSSTQSAQQSFKDVTSLASRPSRSRPLRSARFMPKPPSQVVAHLQRDNDDTDDDDDLDALREVEANEVNSRDKHIDVADIDLRKTDEANNEEPVKTWKKKGQKRTTRRVIMRPVKVKPTEAPTFVAVDDNNEGEQDESDTVEGKTKLQRTNDKSSSATDHDYDTISEDEMVVLKSGEADFISQLPTNSKSKRPQKGKGAKAEKSENSSRKYNPNATSHLNFRTLKIRNKNSKGRGRFGRGRRR